MFSIGNNEMEGLPPLGDTIDCPHCGEQHSVQYGEEVLKDGTKVPSNFLAFYKCPKKGKSYLCGINGNNIMGVIKKRSGE